MPHRQRYIQNDLDNQSKMSVKQIVDRIVRSGKMSPQDHSLLIATVFNQGNFLEEERRQINRVFNHIQTGQVKLINW